MEAPKYASSRATVAKILAALPGTCTTISKAAHISHQSAWRWIPYLVETGQAYVVRIQKPPTGGKDEPYYAAGPAPKNHVVKKQKPLGMMGRTRKYRKKLRETGEIEERRRKEREKYWVSKGVKRDPLVAALFGPVKKPDVPIDKL